ncbi:MAG: acyl-CoA dehydrogenase, partial [Leptospiraceae bacterium]|nr:acyl-CoA dehydrogenase [Leptospiraceae bacterium]
FMESMLFDVGEYPEIPERTDLASDEFLFKQGSTTKGLKKIKIHDYRKAYALYNTPNLQIFQKQIEAFKNFYMNSPISDAQQKDLDYMLSVGEMFTLIPYGQLILERAKQWNIEKELVDRIFDFMVRDFSKYAVQVYTKASSSEEQKKNLLNIIQQPKTNTEDFESALQRFVYSQKDVYEMSP